MSISSQEALERAKARVLRQTGVFKPCENCRQVAGGGLIMSAAHLLITGRRLMGQGGPTTVATVIQITFAACMASIGMVILNDPAGQEQK